MEYELLETYTGPGYVLSIYYAKGPAVSTYLWMCTCNLTTRHGVRRSRARQSAQAHRRWRHGEGPPRML